MSKVLEAAQAHRASAAAPTGDVIHARLSNIGAERLASLGIEARKPGHVSALISTTQDLATATADVQAWRANRDANPFQCASLYAQTPEAIERGRALDVQLPQEKK